MAVDGPKNLGSFPDYYEYEEGEPPPYTPEHVLGIRNIGPPHYSEVAHQNKLRSVYKIRSDRFRSRCMDVTYACINLPDIDTRILRVNRQIHQEAAQVLYSSYTFDFSTHAEAAIPFMNDLTPYSRSLMRRLSITKRALPYDKDFDRAEWFNMCKYIAQNLTLTTLSLGVVSGKPIMGIHDIKAYHESEFDRIVDHDKRDEMQWVRGLKLITGLRYLFIQPFIEHCPPPSSEAMWFFVRFSASVPDGFHDYLRSRMIPVA